MKKNYNIYFSENNNNELNETLDKTIEVVIPEKTQKRKKWRIFKK